MSQPHLTVVPCELSEANAFVARHHRHHTPVVGHRFSIAVADEECEVRGVAIIGRPVARKNNDGWTLEVTRVCTDGCENACSSLYAAAWRAGRAMGYRRIGTYILSSESGTSLKAAGWKVLHKVKGGRTWDCPSRPRVDKTPNQAKLYWGVSA